MKTIVWLGFVLGTLSAAGKVIHTKIGQRLILECGMDDYKRSLSWHHGNVLIISVDGKTGFSRKGNDAIHTRSRINGLNLEISGVKKEDAGDFTCNADGNSHKHTLLVVSVSASPLELQVGSNVMLQCEVEGLSPGSEVQLMRPDGRPHTGSKKGELNVNYTDEGTWECTFSYGTEKYSEKLDVKIKEPASKTPISSLTPTQGSNVYRDTSCLHCSTDTEPSVGQLSWWLWVLVGVGCLVVVLLTVSVIVFCKRIRRKKKNIQKMKNGQQSLMPKQYCQCRCPTAAVKPQQGRQKGKPSALPPLLME
ncbi:uncharacterized protein LOC120784115 [Xiphias gladius]|uniref:uncharacterized protein LOC120784115 n=1 Tax=Xiphias gladius TaxID=8245 RepID=UPI001A9928D2|nr:uncharacterized protein LOC120784115 [Xiphias gladius]